MGHQGPSEVTFEKGLCRTGHLLVVWSLQVGQWRVAG